MNDEQSDIAAISVSIEGDIIEDAVEGSPASLWSVVDLFHQYNPVLTATQCRAAAKELVDRALNKGLIRITRQGEPSFEDTPGQLRRVWEIGSESELKQFRILSTPQSEQKYLSQ